MQPNHPEPILLRLENDLLRVEIAPEIGGRVTSIFNKRLGLEFLWRNAQVPLRRSLPGDAYDPVFFGGIDEVIPGDIPERIRAAPGGEVLDNPDHGELWTLPLEYRESSGAWELHGRLPRWGLRYTRRVMLRQDEAWIDLDYRIENPTTEVRVFLWKLHAALAIDPGDQILCPARMAAVADPEWSRWGDAPPFAWPQISGQRADQIPAPDGTTDFLFLTGFRAGEMGLRRTAKAALFRILFETDIFPYGCLFASYGGLDGHYTAVLEPCTAMPLPVNEALAKGQCSVLSPGEKLETRVSIYAGEG